MRPFVNARSALWLYKKLDTILLKLQLNAICLHNYLQFKFELLTGFLNLSKFLFLKEKKEIKKIFSIRNFLSPKYLHPKIKQVFFWFTRPTNINQLIFRGYLRKSLENAEEGQSKQSICMPANSNRWGFDWCLNTKNGIVEFKWNHLDSDAKGKGNKRKCWISNKPIK